MKLFTTSLILAVVGAVMAIPNPQGTVCAAVCREDKPKCPVGQQPSGSEGCWGCCQPIPYTALEDRAPEASTTFCPTVCLTEPPKCPPGQAPGGGPGCWSCCRPAPTPCLAVCQPVKPVCPIGQEPTGNEDCWGCCQPIGSF